MCVFYFLVLFLLFHLHYLLSFFLNCVCKCVCFYLCSVFLYSCFIFFFLSCLHICCGCLYYHLIVQDCVFFFFFLGFCTDCMDVYTTCFFVTLDIDGILTERDLKSNKMELVLLIIFFAKVDYMFCLLFSVTALMSLGFI